MMENQRPLFLLEEELTYKLRGIFIEISKEHGYLYKENVYQNILKEKLKSNKINFAQHPKITLFDVITGNFKGYYYPDFLVEDKVIIELKAQKQILDTHINQLIRYLQSSKYQVGLLVNFGAPKAEIIRRVYSNERKSFLR